MFGSNKAVLRTNIPMYVRCCTIYFILSVAVAADADADKRANNVLRSDLPCELGNANTNYLLLEI